VFSIQPQERAAYQNLFRDRTVTKIYEAIAPYNETLANQLPMVYRSRIEESEHFLQMKEVPGEPNTDTTIEILEIQKPWARYRLTPGSGKKHQLRCHLNALDIPIRGDQIYPVLTPYQEYDLDFSNPLRLLAKEISFIDPISPRKLVFNSHRTLHFPI
jgi:tRNA pseudouridine32 synthase/23S rRNA pseudouridine746 synthase